MTDTALYASFWKRLWAYGYDSLIVTLLAIGLLIIFSANALPDTDLDDLNRRIQNWLLYRSSDPVLNQLLLASKLLTIYITIASAAYNTLFICGKWQATPGKRFCGIRVIHRNGARLTFWQSAFRHAASGLSMVIWGLGYLSIFFTRERLSLHDIICNSRVIYGNSAQE